jgi:sugar phosphate isomerase/epimerase
MGTRVNRRDLFRAGAAGAASLALPLGSAGAQEAARKMHLGIVTYNVAKDWDLDTILKNCGEAGIEGVEFRTTHAHGVEPSLDAAKRAEIRKRCADAGLLQTSLGSTCEFQSEDPAVVRKNVETCKEFVLLAKDIGARGVKVRPNGLPKDATIPLEKTLEQIGKALAECGRFGAEHGVEIWMEVHGGTTQLVPNSRKIMDACGHKNVGVTWNSNNTDVVSGSIRENFGLIRPWIRCCHITELWSAYPYRELFTLLNQTGYDRFTLCEVGSSIKAEDGVPFLRCYKGLWKELSR